VADPLLRVEKLVRRFGGILATDHVSLDVAKGELHAIIGPNGAGKTTLISQLTGQLMPNSGAIHFAGRDVTWLPSYQRSRLGLARSFQITSLLRDFTAADTANSPGVVIINQTMASTFWPGESPIGKRIDDNEIVGVVNTVQFPANPIEIKTQFQTYCPFAQQPAHSLAVAIRGNMSAGTLQRTVAELDPDQPVGEPGPALAAVGQSLNNLAVGGKMFGSFAGLGLLLAGLGIYGVIAGFVVRRTNEIGVRMALGAQINDVVWLVVGKGLRLSLLGTVIGLMGSFGVTRLIGSIAPGLPAGDPLVLLFVAALLMAVTLFACWLPARRAARVDPLVALRSE